VVLNQDIISTPGAEFNRDIIEHKGDDIFHPIIDLGSLGFQISERCLVIQGGVFSDIIVVIDITEGLVQQLFFAADAEHTRDIKLIIICSVRTFQVGVFLAVPLMVLNEPAAEAADQFPELDDLQPALSTELFPMIDGEDDLATDAMGAEKRDRPEVPTEPVGPSLFSGVGDQFEAGVDIHSAPLEVGDQVTVQMEDLLRGQGLMVSDELDIHLDDLERLSGIPIHKLSFLSGSPSSPDLISDAVFIPPQDIPDGRPGQGEMFVLSQVNGQPFRPEPGLVFRFHHLVFDLRSALAGLPPGSL
jgi:hypothetical protein